MIVLSDCVHKVIPTVVRDTRYGVNIRRMLVGSFFTHRKDIDRYDG